jgi:para-nitrobenzyl esterase
MGPMNVGGFSEDCLTLNVWTPAPSATEHLPVMVWIHGGRLIAGAGSAAWFDAAELAHRGNVVVVSINHRLGALGYLYLEPGTDDEDIVANLGLQDQMLALRWIHDNIGSFGGDPERTTAIGQSSGGQAIVTLASMPAARGLFSRAIVQSSPLGVSPATIESAREATRVFSEEARWAWEIETPCEL